MILFAREPKHAEDKEKERGADQDRAGRGAVDWHVHVGRLRGADIVYL